jgi:hypothetical protein
MKILSPIARMLLAFGLLAGLAACAPLPASAGAGRTAAPTPTEPNYPPPLEYSGTGEASLKLGLWSGPALLHIRAEAGALPFSAAIFSGLDSRSLLGPSSANPGGALDEFRGWQFPASGQAFLQLKGDRAWRVSVLPPSRRYFPTLKVPGTFDGSGSAVVLLEGAYGIAIFRSDRLADLQAWAYGPQSAGAQLSFKLEGDFRGRAVLPEGAGWIVVSAPGAWSVEVQAPCCVAPPGLKEQH